MGKLKDTLGLDELKDKKNSTIWKALCAEFVGNLLLNFFGCASVVYFSEPHSLIHIAITFGFAIFVIVQTIGHVSGGHVNPAVTSAMLVTGNISIIKGVLYIIFQSIGAIAGSAILKALTPESLHTPGLGKTVLKTELTTFQGLGMEFFLGFILVFTVFGVVDQHRPETKATGALSIGLAVALGHLAVIDYTGSSMNPARSLGSALIAGDWTHHWVYWVGPCLGGIAAGILYKYVFAAPPPYRNGDKYGVSSDEKELKRLDGGKNEEA